MVAIDAADHQASAATGVVASAASDAEDTVAAETDMEAVVVAAVALASDAEAMAVAAAVVDSVVATTEGRRLAIKDEIG